MLKKTLQRLYKIEERLYQIDPKILYNFLNEKYTKREMELVGVIFEEITIRWINEYHRFGPINFLNISDRDFDLLEEEIYYLVIEGWDLDKGILAFYETQFGDEIKEVSLEDINKDRSYHRQLRENKYV